MAERHPQCTVGYGTEHHPFELFYDCGSMLGNLTRFLQYFHFDLNSVLPLIELSGNSYHNSHSISSLPSFSRKGQCFFPRKKIRNWTGYGKNRVTTEERGKIWRCRWPNRHSISITHLPIYNWCSVPRSRPCYIAIVLTLQLPHSSSSKGVRFFGGRSYRDDHVITNSLPLFLFALLWREWPSSIVVCETCPSVGIVS